MGLKTATRRAWNEEIRVLRNAKKDPEARYAEARAYLAEVKARREAPSVVGSYCGNVGKAHRAGGVR